MKAILVRIDRLTEAIELGMLTRSEALSMIRSIRNTIADKFEEGSDNFIQCIEYLIDANSIAQEL